MGKQLEALANASTTYHQKGGAQKKREQQLRVGTEWDIRLTTDKDYTLDRIKKCLGQNEHLVLWYLIGGAECGKAWQERLVIDPFTGQPIFDYVHHHICLIFHEPKTFDFVGQMFETKYRNGKYMVVRNPKHTYTGWVLHATKPKTKINPDDPHGRVVREYGTRPMDPNDEETRSQIIRMVQHYGDNTTKLEYGIAPRGDDGHELRKRKRLLATPMIRRTRRRKCIEKMQAAIDALQREKDESDASDTETV